MMPYLPINRLSKFAWLALLLATPLLFWGGPDWTSSALYRAVWDLGHPAFFGLLMLVVRPWRWLAGWRLWLATTVVIGVLGAAIEFIQSFTGRESSVEDALMNLVGAWFGLALSGVSRPETRWQDWLMAAVATALLIPPLYNLVYVARTHMHLAQQAPVLFEVANPDAYRFWRGNVEPVLSGSGQPTALMMNLKPARYSGATLDDLPWDWAGWDMLEIVLENPGERTLNVTLRINDVAHDRRNKGYFDRYNRVFAIEPGMNRLSIALKSIADAPRERQMDMRDIRRLVLFISNLKEPEQLILHRLDLAKKPSA